MKPIKSLAEDPVSAYLDRVCGELAGPAGLRSHLRAELRTHIDDRMAALQTAGLGKREAQALAIAEMGDDVQMKDGLQAVYGRRLTSFLIEKAINWKERSMKTIWKWSFAAQVFLCGTILFELIFVWFCHDRLLPAVLQLTEGMPDSKPDVVEYLGNWITYDSVYWLAGFAMAWIVFELRFKREIKAQVRLAMQSFVAFALAIMGGAYAGLLAISAIIVARTAQ